MNSIDQNNSTSEENNIGRFLFVGRAPLKHQLEKFAKQLQNSYLFTGPPGAGKFDLAIYFARTILCPKQGCGTCSACRAIAQGVHRDLTVLSRSGNFIEVGDVRAALMFATQKPVSSSHQIVLIPEIHLAQRAAPMLLKTVEEPPIATIFIFTAESIQGEIVPIASRCIQVEIPRLSEIGIRAFLDTFDTPPSHIETIVAGSMGRLDFARWLASSEDLLKYLKRWEAVLSSAPTTPWQLSELAQQLEPIPMESTNIEDTKAATKRRRNETDQITMALNYLLWSILKSRPINSHLASQARQLISQAVSSLQLNISYSLVVRELIFSLSQISESEK